MYAVVTFEENIKFGFIIFSGDFSLKDQSRSGMIKKLQMIESKYTTVVNNLTESINICNFHFKRKKSIYS